MISSAEKMGKHNRHKRKTKPPSPHGAKIASTPSSHHPRLVNRRGAIFIPKDDLEANPMLELREYHESIPRRVFSVLNNIETSKEDRKKAAITDTLSAINERVEMVRSRICHALSESCIKIAKLKITKSVEINEMIYFILLFF